MNRRQSSEADKSAARIDLDETGSDASWFTVAPYYKLQHVGDPMRIEDKVALVVATATMVSYLGTSDAARLQDGAHEVSAGGLRTRWKFQLRMRANPKASAPCLRDTDIVRLYEPVNARTIHTHTPASRLTRLGVCVRAPPTVAGFSRFHAEYESYIIGTLAPQPTGAAAAHTHPYRPCQLNGRRAMGRGEWNGQSPCRPSTGQVKVVRPPLGLCGRSSLPPTRLAAR